MKVATAVRSTLAQNLIAAMANGSASSPIIEVYAGNMPASMGGAIVNTKLATLTLTNNVATEADGVITFEAITEDSSADNTGRAEWCRALDRNGAETVYLTINDNGSGEIEFNSADLVAGSPVAIGELVLTIGGA